MGLVDGEAECICGGIDDVAAVAQIVAFDGDGLGRGFDGVAGDGFRLRTADHATLEGIGHGEGELAVKAGIEDEVDFADVLGCGPAEFY